MVSTKSFDAGKYFKYAIVGLYAWLAAFSLGAALIDIVYAGLVSDTTAFAEAADFLLLLAGSTVLVAFAALVVAWNNAFTRNLIIASLVFTIMGLLTPSIVRAVFGVNDVGLLGPAVRLIGGGLVALLALAAFYSFVDRT